MLQLRFLENGDMAVVHRADLEVLGMLANVDHHRGGN